MAYRGWRRSPPTHWLGAAWLGLKPKGDDHQDTETETMDLGPGFKAAMDRAKGRGRAQSGAI